MNKNIIPDSDFREEELFKRFLEKQTTGKSIFEESNESAVAVAQEPQVEETEYSNEHLDYYFTGTDFQIIYPDEEDQTWKNFYH